MAGQRDTDSHLQCPTLQCPAKILSQPSSPYTGTMSMYVSEGVVPIFLVMHVFIMHINLYFNNGPRVFLNSALLLWLMRSVGLDYITRDERHEKEKS